ncbi:unknown [Brachyspira sp. CAG:700]|nr:unknown [Brachyspira sp. CAG:700]
MNFILEEKMKVKKEYLENDKNIIDFLEENQNREDFEIIDLNTNKKVSVQECVDIMIKNSSIYNDSEEDK